jgi:hypothetical protein
MNTGSLEASEGIIGSSPGEIIVKQEKAEGLKGLGFKLWVDFLPFVDVEGTFNITAARYKTTLTQSGNTFSLDYPLEAPYSILFDDASPIYGVASGDLSITYPFDILPIVRPYIGAGLSYFISTQVVNTAFVEKVVDPNNLAAFDKINDAVIEKLKKSEYETGIGGHIIAGIRIKPPMIPAAIYANGKYYFGGNTNSQFSQGLVLELGGGFAL